MSMADMETHGMHMRERQEPSHGGGMTMPGMEHSGNRQKKVAMASTTAKNTTKQISLRKASSRL